MWKKVVGWLKNKFKGKKPTGGAKMIGPSVVIGSSAARVVGATSPYDGPSGTLSSSVTVAGSSSTQITSEQPTYEIDVQVTRLETGTGSGLCSTGIPLPQDIPGPR